ncbi:MAG: S-layer homology domain-containing protein [Acidobacteriota bacterium]
MIALGLVITVASTRVRADTGSCGGATTTLPFTDVMGNLFFCQIAEAFFSGLTSGTSATTYSPAANVTREQIAAFITRTMDQSLKRGSRRAALKQFWTPTSADGLGLTTVGNFPRLVESDGADLWVANEGSGTVSRVRASDGKLLETWTGATGAVGVVAAKGLIFVTGNTTPGNLYQIDPTQPVGAVTTLTSSLEGSPQGISFDGARIWTPNIEGSVSIVTLNPLSVTTVTAGFSSPRGILYDGANMWVTDFGAGNLFKLDSNGAIIQTVTVGTGPFVPVFDGTNIWVPNNSSSTVTVVRASTGAVLATLTGNGLFNPWTAAFDGERILVTNINGNSVSLWKAADLTPLGSVSTGGGTGPLGACSDGLNFWITLNGTGKLARF